MDIDMMLYVYWYDVIWILLWCYMDIVMMLYGYWYDVIWILWIVEHLLWCYILNYMYILSTLKRKENKLFELYKTIIQKSKMWNKYFQQRDKIESAHISNMM